MKMGTLQPLRKEKREANMEGFEAVQLVDYQSTGEILNTFKGYVWRCSISW